MSDSTARPFGLDAITFDDRLRLFSFATSENRLEYLWILRAVDAVRSNYQVIVATQAVAQSLEALAEHNPECPVATDVDLSARMDALEEWGVLDRTQDATRAATLAEYRKRHSVYQFTEAGHRAFKAVESVLDAKLEQVSLRRLVFKELLEDLEALAAANVAGDSEVVFRRFDRIDTSLNDIAERAARFYTMLSDLTRTTEVDAEIFQTHKDALITHLRDFHTELQRYSPLLYDAAVRLEETGIASLVEAAAEADERPFASYKERLSDWGRRWEGVKAWLAPPSQELGSEADRLVQATSKAISDLTGMVRQLADAKRGGMSRESQLRHLAAWFMNLPTQEAAHALFDATFSVGGPRHINKPFDDLDMYPTSASWWDTPAVELSKTLLEKARNPGTADTKGGKVKRRTQQQRELREHFLEKARRQTEAAAALAEGTRSSFDATILDHRQLAILLSLIDQALSRHKGQFNRRLSATAFGVRLVLYPRPGIFTVKCQTGTFRVDGLAVELETLS